MESIVTTTIQLDNRQVCLEKPIGILSLLSREKQQLFRPRSFEEPKWINNPRCPLVNLVEVDGQVVPIAVWADRPVRDGMVIRTRSQQLESVLQERLRHLRDHQAVPVHSPASGVRCGRGRIAWADRPGKACRVAVRATSLPAVDLPRPELVRSLPSLRRYVQHDAGRRGIKV